MDDILDFEQCKELFENSTTAQALYGYHGHVWGGQVADSNYISLKGCEVLCGRGAELNHWRDALVTITTWVLPMLGMLLAAPFESNNFARNLRALCRWLGSPIISISNILWNIMLNARACLLLDMAVFIDETPAQDSRFGRFRDSLYILGTLNQYTMPRYTQEMEGLVRIALFCDIDGPETPGSLCVKRRDLAQNLRANRRRGVVPALISLFWFLFCLAMSIESAFAEIGMNTIAHNLALGLLLTWLPILIVFSIIDRNPSGESDLMERLNELLTMTSQKMQDQGFVEQLCSASGISLETLSLVRDVQLPADGGIFTHFAGQSREYWFLGIAHNIVMGIEANHAARHGRGWLYDVHRSNAALWRPYGTRPFSWLNARAVWQVLIAVIVVCGCAGGAFVISYFTPTVGLGCRSGGYMVYCVNALFLFSCEMCSWHWADRDEHVRKYGSFFLLAIELINSCWLCWIVFAQVTGAYQTCECMSSTWSPGGGYIDFGTVRGSAANRIEAYWFIGTSLTCFIFFCSIVFIVVQWCEQAHLNTLEYDNAMRGLIMTRRFRMATCWLRSLSDRIGSILGVTVAFILGKRHQRTRLKWSWMPRVRRISSPALTSSSGQSSTVYEEAKGDVDVDSRATPSTSSL